MQSAKIRPGADCGSVHELLIAKLNEELFGVRTEHCSGTELTRKADTP